MAHIKENLHINVIQNILNFPVVSNSVIRGQFQENLYKSRWWTATNKMYWDSGIWPCCILAVWRWDSKAQASSSIQQSHSLSSVPADEFAQWMHFFIYLTALFVKTSTCNVEFLYEGEKWIEKTWKQRVVASFKALFWYLPRVTEKKHETLNQIAWVVAEIRTKQHQNTSQKRYRLS
jgi:hypothetical protein